jgi:DNA (cytosine-5)-methyltransferase 1
VRYPLITDLFCGEGGASKGYSRAGFAVRGVDNNGSRLAHYPFEHVTADALAELVHEVRDFVDAYHASPPCTGYTRGTAAIPDRLERYDRLIPIVRELLEATGKPYVIENVTDARSEMRDPALLCWTQFYRPGSVLDDDGTPLQMYRHRLFETNWPLMVPPHMPHDTSIQVAGSYGGARRDKHEAREIRKGGYVPSADRQRELIGVPWMTEKGCQLSIPPAYTEFIGTQLRDYVMAVAA